jgi:hypothetical protein
MLQESPLVKLVSVTAASRVGKSLTRPVYISAVTSFCTAVKMVPAGKLLVNEMVDVLTIEKSLPEVR